MQRTYWLHLHSRRAGVPAQSQCGAAYTASLPDQHRQRERNPKQRKLVERTQGNGNTEEDDGDRDPNKHSPHGTSATGACLEAIPHIRHFISDISEVLCGKCVNEVTFCQFYASSSYVVIPV